MKYSCIIVDDEQTARNILKRYVSETPLLNLKAECKNAIEAIEYLQKNPVDIVFLDIEMPKLSGLNLARIIESNIQVIFTTAHREFAVEGFDLNATDYLLKPFSLDRFLTAVKRAIEKQKPSQNEEDQATDHMYFKVDKKMVKIMFSAILYIEGLGNYLKIHTVENAFIIYDKMSSLEELLHKHKFRRIHKSYIVNTGKINAYTKEFVEIGRKQLPVSSTYRDRFMSSF